jgi:hypothetical protein
MSPHSVENGKVNGKFEKAIGTGAFVVDKTGKESDSIPKAPPEISTEPLCTAEFLESPSSIVWNARL